MGVSSECGWRGSGEGLDLGVSVGQVCECVCGVELSVACRVVK